MGGGLIKSVLALTLSINLIATSLIFNISTDAASQNNASSLTSSISSIIASSSSISISKNKRKVKVINNEVDPEPEIILNEKDQKRYEDCKKEVISKRAKRFKNKPTPCFKTVSNPNGEKDKDITPEDYNILWAAVAENKELIETKVDPNKEITLSEYLANYEIDSSTSSSSLSNSIISSTNSTQTTSSSSVLSVTLSSISNSTSISSQASAISVQSNSSSSKISWLDNLLNFGAIKASAAIDDGFKLPYENGVRAVLTQKSFNDAIWDGGKNASHWDYAAFDFVGEGQNYKIVASKPGKVVYSADNNNGFGKHIVIEHPDGSFAVYAHLNLRKVAVGTNVIQAQYIGDEGSTGVSAQHLHFEVFNRFPCATSGKIEDCYIQNSTAITGYKGNAYYLASALKYPKFVECPSGNNCKDGRPENNGAYFTSQNQSYTNNYGGFIKANDNSQLVLGANGQDNGGAYRINLQQGAWSGGSEGQRFGYIASTKEIRGPDNRCLDAGNVNDSSNRYLRMSGCHGGNNQKWERDTSGRVHSLENYNQCIDAYGGNNLGTTIGVWDCGTQGNQKWNVSDLGMPLPGPTYNKFVFRRTGTNQCLDFNNVYDGTPIYTWECNFSNSNQIFNAIPSPYGGNAFQRMNTNKCIDAWSPYNGRPVYGWECDINASNHNWYYDWNTKMIQQRNTNQCLAKWNPNNGSQINTSTCNQFDGNLKWDAIQV